MAVRYSGPHGNVAFASCQERKVFPTHYAPNRLGNTMSYQRNSHLGPGCYDNHEIYTFAHDIQKRPESNKGYVIAARTAARFIPNTQTIVLSPQKYQPDNTRPKVFIPNRTPFNSTNLRFRTKSVAADCNPGPGAYTPEVSCSKKVSWPMKFGSPDWARLSKPERRALRVELPCDKEFQKQRTREAYLSLFYS
ncbi:ciliary microtubule-associated protein 3-like [Osmerus eperlanus]|uniref:ciliary microtubule-associated protein 3-like n=1 Tax=Osmerus eperlanus TaxID=29151 RepID=UPI002E0F04E8